MATGVSPPGATFQVTEASKLSNQEQIGEGGFGKVYRAEHRQWGTVAYKKLPVGFIKKDGRDAYLLKHEASVQSELKHPNIVLLLAMVFEDDNYGVILEYMKYGALNEFIQEFVVPWQWKLHVATDIATGMSYLHSKDPPVIHRDLKIRNVLIGDGYRAKISDFGLSQWKTLSKSRSKNRSSCCGTVTHIAPEMWENVQQTRPVKSDVYGFGILMWEIATEEVPFDNVEDNVIRVAVMAGDRPSIDALPQEMPSQYKALMMKSWSPNPSDRPDFVDIKDSLNNFISTAKMKDAVQQAYTQICRKGEWRDISRNSDTIQTNSQLPLACTELVDTMTDLGIERRKIQPTVTSYSNSDSTSLKQVVGSSSRINFPENDEEMFVKTVPSCAVVHHNLRQPEDRIDGEGAVAERANLVDLRSDPQDSGVTDPEDPSIARDGPNSERPAHLPQTMTSCRNPGSHPSHIVNLRSDCSHSESSHDSVEMDANSDVGRVPLSRGNIAAAVPTPVRQPARANPSHIVSSQVAAVTSAGDVISAAVAALPNFHHMDPTIRGTGNATFRNHRPESTTRSAPDIAYSHGSTRPMQPLNAHSQTVRQSQPHGQGSVMVRTPGTEIHVYNTGSLGPGVQIGNNNVMHITNSSSTSCQPKKSHSGQVKGASSKVKKQIKVPDKVVDSEVLLLISTDIGNDWRKLGRELRLTDGVLDAVCLDYQADGLREVAYQMLREWHEQLGNDATVEVVAKALVSIKRADIAKKLSTGCS